MLPPLVRCFNEGVDRSNFPTIVSLGPKVSVKHFKGVKPCNMAWLRLIGGTHPIRLCRQTYLDKTQTRSFFGL